jgi:hypothetical protein
MAERVEVIRVGEGARMKQIGKKWSDKHTVGTYKAVETNSWLVGIESREHKLGRIERATEFNKLVQVTFEQWCVANNLTPNSGIVAFLRKVAREYVRNGPKMAELLLSAVPPAYRRFWDEHKETLISGYKNIRT